MGFPDGSEGKASACNAGDSGLIPGSGRSPWRRKWQPTPVFLPRESPWTAEPGWLQSMGSQRVRHDWATSLSLSLHMTWKTLQGNDAPKKQSSIFFVCFKYILAQFIYFFTLRPCSMWDLISLTSGPTHPALEVSRECRFLGSLSRHDKDLERWTLKLSMHHSSRILDKLCYSS